jgi:arsenite methyltransferase
MKWRQHIAIFGLLMLPFADACSDVKRLAYDDLGRRDGWQEPERVVESLALEPGQKLADLGAGGGYFTFRLARSVGPGGTVYAVDVDEPMLERLSERAAEAELSQVRTVLAKPNDPMLPEPVDLIFVSNTYHHIEDRVQYFAGVQRHLRAGGRVAVLEFGTDGTMQSCGHGTLADQIRSEMQAAGYTMTQQLDFTTRQSFQIFEVAPR